MKPLALLLTVTLLTAASLTACGASENSMSIEQQMEQRFKLNPHPKEAYRIRIKINDAPGPLKLMHDMSVGYRAENCSYLITNEFTGVKAHPEKTLKIPIRQIGYGEYESIVHLDAMKDEDYFGEGTCQWKAEGFGTLFKATGKKEETGFNVGDSINNIIKQKSLIKYYQKRGYPYYKNTDGFPIENHNIPDFGENSIQEYGSELQKDLFSITLTIEEL